MVRNIVGTLIEAGRGKIAVGFVKEILDRGERRHCGPKVAARGLCLMSVKY
jgi:tRNA pseudouridine38-40 synthase